MTMMMMMMIIHIQKVIQYIYNYILLIFLQAFLDIDYEMLHNESWGEQMAGSTAVVVLVKDNVLYCANAGDSRAIACINGKLEILSVDHKPNNENESKRIIEGGGWVEFNRVNGNLALSRALGDFVFKRSNKKPEDQIVTGKQRERQNENIERCILLLALIAAPHCYPTHLVMLLLRLSS